MAGRGRIEEGSRKLKGGISKIELVKYFKHLVIGRCPPLSRKTTH